MKRLLRSTALVAVSLAISCILAYWFGAVFALAMVFGVFMVLAGLGWRQSLKYWQEAIDEWRLSINLLKDAYDTGSELALLAHQVIVAYTAYDVDNAIAYANRLQTLVGPPETKVPTEGVA